MPRVLDLSFNLIKAIPESLASLKSIQTIYFVQNKISKIQHLDAVGATLQSLELGGNRLRVRDFSYVSVHNVLRWTLPQMIENLDSLVNLRELWLGKNKITKLEVIHSPGIQHHR